MWRELDYDEKQIIVNKILSERVIVHKPVGVCLILPFLLGIAAVVSCILSHDSVMPVLAAMVFYTVFTLAMFLSDNARIDVKCHVYVTEPMIVCDVYEYGMYSTDSPSYLINCNNMTARKVDELHIGDMCVFIQFGEDNLEDDYDIINRFAISTQYLKNVNSNVTQSS